MLNIPQGSPSCVNCVYIHHKLIWRAFYSGQGTEGGNVKADKTQLTYDEHGMISIIIQIYIKNKKRIPKMAKVRNNIITQGLSGMLGDQIVFRAGRNGQTIVTARPSYDPNRVLSSAQQAHMEAFRQAIAYAKTAKDNVVYITRAKGTALTPYNVAVADWFSKPEVLEINASGWTGAVDQVIRIKAQEEMHVANVTVVIKNVDGTVVEQGVAQQVEGLWWEYTTTQPFSLMSDAVVVATAYDLAGNTAELTWQGS
jgi:hypothetical protein